MTAATNRGTNSARDEVLSRIRAALDDDSSDRGPESAEADSGQTATSAAGPHLGPAYRSQGSLKPAELLNQLAERIADYRAEVRRCAPDELTASVTRALTGRFGGRSASSGCRIVRPPDLELPGLDLAELERATRSAGIEIVPDQGMSAAELDAAAGVLTGAAVAIAQTGTIILDGSAAQGRRAVTLVPDYHLCVVLASQVVELVPEAIARLEPVADRPLTWISGPSATSDIELDRVEGVHGPRTLEVILVGP